MYTKNTRPWSVSKVNEFTPRIKSLKDQFQLSADLNLKNSNFLSSASGILRLKFMV